MKTQWLKSMKHSKNSLKREIYSTTGLHKTTRKISNEQPNLISKILEKNSKQNSKWVEERK